MIKELYARWMYDWETRLTTRDSNRIVRPLEWGFDWLQPALRAHGLASRAAALGTNPPADSAEARALMLDLNRAILADSTSFFSYRKPTDYRLEERAPHLFPTNVRPETLAKDARIREMAADGRVAPAQFLRFTSPERTPYPENDLVNARWFPAPAAKQVGRPLQAMIVMPQWNADAFSHNALCNIFNRMGISCLRLSKPYHDIRRPSEIERSDYAVSANIGRTLSATRQAVVDIRCSLDWLESQGYEDFGILGTSLGSCYAFLASAHDRRLRVNAFNHASAAFGDVVWVGQSTRHIRQALEEAGLDQQAMRELWAAISPMHYYETFAQAGGQRAQHNSDPDATKIIDAAKKVLLVYARYDLTFPYEYSLEVLDAFRRHHIDFEPRLLPCGHYTTGESPFQYIDAWYLGSFVYRSFKALRGQQPAGSTASAEREDEREAAMR